MLNFKLTLQRRRQWLLSVPSFIFTSVLTGIPTYAATFAFSEAKIELNNFSNFGTIELVNQANISGQTNGGIFGAENKAFNNSTASPLQINSSAFSLAFGENRDYEGTAEAQARVLGNFDVDAGQLFSFDFSAALNLETEIDDPLSEQANARSDISFYLFDTVNIPQVNVQDYFKYQPLDYFTLNASLNTFGYDFLNYQRSQGVSFTNENKQTMFGANQETASAIIQGKLQRSFTNKTNVTLIALRQTKSQVKVPEHSMLVPLIFLVATITVGVLRNK
ncbi:MAG: hypothetical protein KME29_18765 [Calothrix sp. FI2-JRJ7]|jgi:hypothetical protein|nr:hypothetical protein [Calothrix sp. FI2-JRJ7]